MWKALFLTFAAILTVSLAQKCSNILENDYEYWTPERMAEAIPYNRVLNTTTGLTQVSLGQKLGACQSDWTKYTTKDIYTTFPYRAVGKIFFKIGSSSYVCSGSIGDETNGRIWTAGHCVYSSDGGFHSNFLFVPGYYNGAAPYGQFYASRLCTTSGYYASEDMGVDYAIAILEDDLPSGIGSLKLATNYNQETQVFTSAGYPQGAPFNGSWENTCQSSACYLDSYFTPTTTGISCDSTGGCSGGPWLVNDDSIGSVNSYGYPTYPNYLFGPYFNSATSSFFSGVGDIADADRLIRQKK